MLREIEALVLRGKIMLLTINTVSAVLIVWGMMCWAAAYVGLKPM